MDQAVATPIKQKELARNVVSVYGKIAAVRKLTAKQTKEKYFASLITLPSSGDEFAAPQTVEVTSSDELGKVGDVITAQCALGGYRRSFSVTDPDTGEITKHWTADITLRAI